MKKYSKIYKKKLLKVIDDMTLNLDGFVKQPGKDFTRNRKLNFKKVMQTILTIDGGTLKSEFLKSYEFDKDAPSTSAFVQQRKKILPSAFKHLLQEQLKHKKQYKKLKGYRTVAIDGSQLAIPFNPRSKDTYKQHDAIGPRGCNSLLINAFYDLQNKIYLDANIQGLKSMNEKAACEELISSSAIKEPVILIADRGYEGYSLLCTIDEKKWKYLIRVKDKDSNGMFSKVDFPASDECDFRIKWDFVYSGRKAYREKYKYHKQVKKPNSIKVMEKNKLEHYLLNIRIVRVEISENHYETLITNLSETEFNPDELKDLYNQRWGIETSFRKLKYTIGLSNLHSKGRDCMEQEILGKLIMYNYCEMVTSEVIIKQNKKHIHQANFRVAVQVCKSFLRHTNTKVHLDVEKIIQNNTLPVRPGRVAPRRRRRTINTGFLYRV